MTHLSGQERARYVQSMFTRIAHRYDLMNRLMTGGQDLRWRKTVIQLAGLKPNASLLDLGTGTGDLAREALTQQPQARVTAADFTIEMMRVGRKPGGRIVILDTTRPKKNLLSPFIWIHMHVIIPILGGLLSGFKDAYNYLPDSTEGFLTAEELASHMSTAGFKNVNFKQLMFGTIAIHHGEK
ncbi:MAG: class I SAM-dependent methyltransferase [Chloroflexi bacterium]|nr:class I SAM-dependent methyltransferase [Chloroflexota bacterium]